MQSDWKRFIPGCIGGNILELYEFIIYGYFSKIIGSLFFPIQNEYLSLMAAFAVFATGSVIRPFSAIFLGYLGDRLGRRVSLIISISTMAASTVCIGLLPTFSQIGLIAPLLLLICRIGQGFSMTNEQVGAALFLIENAPKNEKGYAGSLILGSVYLGLLAGSIIANMVFSFIPDQALSTWGWRLPFLIGGVTGFIVLIIRIQQPDSLEFSNALKNKTHSLNPFTDLLKTNLISTLRITLLFSLMAVSVYLYAIYFINVINVNPSLRNDLILTNSFAFILTFLISMLTGKIVDKIGFKIPIIVALLGFIILAYPMFLLLSQATLFSLILMYACFATLQGIIVGSIMLAAIKPFPVNIRFIGSCVSFNLSMSIFGGPAPLLALYLTKITNSSTAPSLLLIGTALISLLTIIIPEKNYIEEKINDNPISYQNG